MISMPLIVLVASNIYVFAGERTGKSAWIENGHFFICLFNVFVYPCLRVYLSFPVRSIASPDSGDALEPPANMRLIEVGKKSNFPFRQ